VSTAGSRIDGSIPALPLSNPKQFVQGAPVLPDVEAAAAFYRDVLGLTWTIERSWVGVPKLPPNHVISHMAFASSVCEIAMVWGSYSVRISSTPDRRASIPQD
jgi:hypothetical protein